MSEEIVDDFVRVDYEPLEEIFKRVVNKDERFKVIGIGSSGRGWSRYSTLQRCPQAFYYSYVKAPEGGPGQDTDALAIGSGVHACLAVRYAHGRDAAEAFLAALANEQPDPLILEEFTRLYRAYLDNYGEEPYIKVLAVEQRVENPETTDSCRYDAIMHFEHGPSVGELPGTYIVEHKTLSRFDDSGLNGWHIHGEILGEVAFYQAAKLHEVYGPLRGVVMNLIGKQKVPKFERSVISPSAWQIQKHVGDLKVWREYEYALMKTGVYPRATANCIGQYGKCQYYQNCSMR